MFPKDPSFIRASAASYPGDGLGFTSSYLALQDAGLPREVPITLHHRGPGSPCTEGASQTRCL